MLARIFGNMNIELKEFRELLLIDSTILNNGVMALVNEMKIELYSCEFVNRVNLLRIFHGNIYTKPQNPHPSLIQAFSQDIEKLRQMSLLIEKLSESEIASVAMKTQLDLLKEENLALKETNTKLSAELETANTTKTIMDKLISDNNNYKAILLEFKQKMSSLED